MFFIWGPLLAGAAQLQSGAAAPTSLIWQPPMPTVYI